MATHYTFRLQISPRHDPEDATRQLLKLADQTGMDEDMVQFYAEEMNDGHEPLEGIREWVERSRPWRQAVQKAGLKISLNPWHTLMHNDFDLSLKPGQDWQTMVDPTGYQTKTVVCPLDAGWQAYFAEALSIYAAEGPGLYWIDDDIRLHNHGTTQWGGCFCPLHVAQFNRRTGLKATREEIVANCTAPGEPHPWREQWLDMWEESMLALIGGWREIVEARGGRLGLMSSRIESHAAEGRRWKDWWKALSGDKPPIHRPYFWSYCEATSPFLVDSIALLDENRAVHPEGVECGPEIDGVLGQWNKSDAQWQAQMALAHVLGAQSLNMSPYTFLGENLFDEPARNAMLKAWKPVCAWLGDEFPMTMRSQGVGVLWSQDMGRRIRTETAGNWESLVCAHRGWARWLGAAGHAISMRPSSHTNALGGKTAWAFSDDELTQWLSKGLLIDAVAAQILVQRGFGTLIGFERYEVLPKIEVGFTSERCTDPEFSLRQGARMTLLRWNHAAHLMRAELLPGTRVVSDVLDARMQPVGHGTVLFENELGGRVALLPWDVNADLNMNAVRQYQLTRVLRYLDPSETHAYVSGNAWLVPQFLSDGKRWRGVIWNACTDEVARLHLHPPTAMQVKRAEHVARDGKRHLPRLEGEMLHFDTPLRQWEFVVVSDG